MQWRDQIEARTNAANTSAVWKYFKAVRERRRNQYERLFSAASHVSDETRKRWMLPVTDDWNHEMLLNN